MKKHIAELLKEKASYVRDETLRLHVLAPDSRIASCLSMVEIFTVLYYGRILRFKPSEPGWESRDRLVISKGHGGMAVYPILADLAFFPPGELKKTGSPGALLKTIPDSLIPGIETINGSLGNGPGYGCGIALALRALKSLSTVFVIVGDGELNEGAVWEAVMFAGHQKLGNLLMVVDANRRSMLGYCREIIDMEPLKEKFAAFNWEVFACYGHDVKALYRTFMDMKKPGSGKPRVLIADTVKGRGVPELEDDSLCHVKSLSGKRVKEILGGLHD